MGRKCSVPNCKSGYASVIRDPNIKISYHRVPGHPLDLRERWLKAMGRPRWNPTIHAYVCSLHFVEDSDFVTETTDKNPSKARKKREDGLKIRLLKKAACPSIFRPFLHLRVVPKVKPVTCFIKQEELDVTKEDDVDENEVEEVFVQADPIGVYDMEDHPKQILLQGDHIATISELKDKLDRRRLPPSAAVVDQGTSLLFLSLKKTQSVGTEISFSLEVKETLKYEAWLGNQPVPRSSLVHIVEEKFNFVSQVLNTIFFLSNLGKDAFDDAGDIVSKAAMLLSSAIPRMSKEQQKEATSLIDKLGLLSRTISAERAGLPS